MFQSLSQKPIARFILLLEVSLEITGISLIPKTHLSFQVPSRTGSASLRNDLNFPYSTMHYTTKKITLGEKKFILF